VPPPPPPSSAFVPPPTSFGPLPPPTSVDPGLPGQPIPPSPTAGLRTATIALFWCTVGAAWAVVGAVASRRATFDEYRRGEATLDDVDNADVLVQGVSILETGLAIAALIVVSIWALKATQHVQRFGANDVSPGLACGGWYIPFGNFVVPFVQLRRVARFRGRSVVAIGWWQALFIAQACAGFGLRSVDDFESVSTTTEISDRLGLQIVLAALAAVGLTASAIVAMRATRDVQGADLQLH